MNKKGVIVTGGAQGIGMVTCLKLLQEDYLVCSMDNDQGALMEFKMSVSNKNLFTFSGDVSNEGDVMKCVEFANKQFNGGIYGLVNNAAIAENKSIEELGLEDWNQVISVNLTGVFLMTKYAAEFLTKQTGSIVNIASTRALMSEGNTEAYSASKGGVISLTHALAVSLAPKVRVNAISPGWIETGHLKKTSNRKPVHHSDTDKNQHLSGRVGTADDVAEMVLFLLSEKSGFITGQNFVVDGGMTKKMVYL